MLSFLYIYWMSSEATQKEGCIGGLCRALQSLTPLINITYCKEGPTWIIYWWNWLRVKLCMSLHYNWRHVIIFFFNFNCPWYGFLVSSKGPHNFMVTTLAQCKVALRLANMSSWKLWGLLSPESHSTTYHSYEIKAFRSSYCQYDILNQKMMATLWNFIASR